MCKVWK